MASPGAITPGEEERAWKDPGAPRWQRRGGQSDSVFPERSVHCTMRGGRVEQQRFAPSGLGVIFLVAEAKTFFLEIA